MFTNYNTVDVLVTTVLFLIMFGLGLSISSEDYRKLLHHPLPIFLGLGSQMIMLPLIVFLLVSWMPITPALKVGFVILSACPGGSTSGLLTYLFRGNVALSISLTCINAFLTLLTIPFITNLGLRLFMHHEQDLHLPMTHTIGSIFFVTLLPATLGTFVRRWHHAFAIRMQRYLKPIMLLLLGTIFVIKIFASEESGGSGISWSEGLHLLPYTLLISAFAFYLAYFLGKSAHLDSASAFTLGIETSMQNTTLAFLISGTLLNNQEMLKPALIYAMLSFWTALIYSIHIKRGQRLKVFGPFID